MRITLLAVFGLIPFCLFSEQPTPNGQNNQTVENAYLNNTDNAIRAMEVYNEGSDRDSKQWVLDQAEQLILNEKNDKGSSSSGPLSFATNVHFMNLLDNLSKEGTSAVSRVNNRLINDYPDVRRRTAEYLGLIKGDRSEAILINMVNNEKEPMVLAEIVFSLAQVVGSESEKNKNDRDGSAEYAVANIVKTQDSVRPDNNLAYASITAIRKIAKTKAGDLKPELIEAVVRIAQGNYIRSVRTAASDLMKELVKNYGKK